MQKNHSLNLAAETKSNHKSQELRTDCVMVLAPALSWVAADANWSHQESEKATGAGETPCLGPHTSRWQVPAGWASLEDC